MCQVNFASRKVFAFATGNGNTTYSCKILDGNTDTLYVNVVLDGIEVEMRSGLKAEFSLISLTENTNVQVIRE